MLITVEQLKTIRKNLDTTRLSQIIQPLNTTLKEFEIITPKRISAFIAQVAHESGGFQYFEELASGVAYEGRLDLGNTEPGDGRRFKGRGLIQITGRDNYRQCGNHLKVDLLKHPELLASETELACRSAGWYWSSRKLNQFADVSDLLTISVRINGRNRKTGLPNGWDDRLAYFENASRVLGSA